MEKMRYDMKKGISLFIYCVLVCILCLGSSPILHYMTPDSSIFWSIGRAMAKGKVAYKDIFDHKGFYLWVINWLGALVSTKSTVGLFFIEVIFNYANVVLVYLISSYYLKEKLINQLLSISFLGISLNYFTCRTGNLTEYYGVTFQLISFLLIVKYYKEHMEIHPAKYMFMHGICSGILLFMQANILGMWIPFGIILAYQMFKNKQYKVFARNLLALLSGVICVTIPVLVYGIHNSCLKEIIDGTFVANMKYSQVNRDGTPFGIFLKRFVCQPAFLIVIVAVLSCFVVWKYERTLFMMFTSMLIVTVIFMNVALRPNENYFHSYLVFTLPTMIFLMKQFFSKFKAHKIFVLVIFVLSIMLNLQLVKQILHLGQSTVVYKASKEIKDIINPNDDREDCLLITGCWATIYNDTNTIPQIKYFVTFGGGLHYDVFPDAVEMQKDAIKSNRFQYVLIPYGTNNQIYGVGDIDEEIVNHISENYTPQYEIDEAGIYMILYEKRNDY